MPAAVEAWKAAVTPANVIAGFRRTGIHPYDPEAWKLTSTKEVVRLGGLPLLVSAAAELAQQPAIAPLVSPHAIALIDAVGREEKKKCGECGQSPRKPPAPRLTTEAGLLLTSDDTRKKLQAILDGRREKKEEVERKRTERVAAKVAKAATAATAATAGKGRKRKAKETDTVDAAKENASPNTADLAAVVGHAVVVQGKRVEKRKKVAGVVTRVRLSIGGRCKQTLSAVLRTVR